MKTPDTFLVSRLKPWVEKTSPLRRGAMGALATALLGSALSASAVTLVIDFSGPTPGPNDVYNFTGGANDAANVGGGADPFTYVARDRASQGQTFTTPTAEANGYLLTDLWIRHCGYTADVIGNGTWWNLTRDARIAVRITDPASNGTTNFVLHSENYTITATENAGGGWGGGGGLGDDAWVHLTLGTPVQLDAGTQYGFDLTCLSTVTPNFYFEWLGNSTNVFADGTAYTGTTGGTPGNTVNNQTGDRVFLVQLSTRDSVPVVTPTFTTPSRFAPMGQPVQVTLTIPDIVNANQTVTMDLYSANSGVIAFSANGVETMKTLTFQQGATNVQTFNAYVLADGQADVYVNPNVWFNYATITLGSSVAVSEAFAYDSAVQPTLDGAAGGTGFGFNAWYSSLGTDTAIVPGLSFGAGAAQLVVSSNAASISGGDNAFRTLPSTYGGVGGGTVWVGFLVNGAGLTNWGGFSLFSGSGTTEQLFMGTSFGSSPNDTWGFLRGGQVFMNFAGSVTPGNRTDLLVYRIDFSTDGSGQALVSCYVNPTLNGSAPYTPTGSGYVDNFTFDSIRLGTDGGVTFDQIRIGASWSAVVPFTGTPQSLEPPVPTLSTPARFSAVGQDAVVTVTIPTNAPRPITLSITNDNPAAFRLSATNAAETTLTLSDPNASVQTFNVTVLGAGVANLTVVPNSTVKTANLTLAAQVSAREPFAYAELVDGLPGSAGGVGFDTNVWTGGGSVSSPGLSYAGLASSGNAVSISTGNAARTLFTSAAGAYGGASGGTVWISFLARGAFPVGEQHSAWVFLLSGTAQPFRMGMSTAESNNGKWGFGSAGAGSNLIFPDSVPPSTNTDLLVYRLDFPVLQGGLVNVTFYANPPVGPAPPGTPTGTGSAFYFTFDGINITSDLPMNFDEVRLGGTWAEVVPAAVVAGPELHIQRLAGNQVQLSWPVNTDGTYDLLSSPSVLGPWDPAGLSVSMSGDNYVATDTVAGTAKFYRLLKQ